MLLKRDCLNERLHCVSIYQSDGPGWNRIEVKDLKKKNAIHSTLNFRTEISQLLGRNLEVLLESKVGNKNSKIKGISTRRAKKVSPLALGAR